ELHHPCVLVVELHVEDPASVEPVPQLEQRGPRSTHGLDQKLVVAVVVFVNRLEPGVVRVVLVRDLGSAWHAYGDDRAAAAPRATPRTLPPAPLRPVPEPRIVGLHAKVIRAA